MGQSLAVQREKLRHCDKIDEEMKSGALTMAARQATSLKRRALFEGLYENPQAADEAAPTVRLSTLCVPYPQSTTL